MTDWSCVLIDDPAAPAGTPVALRDVDPAEAHVLVSDLGVNRGDGIFEAAGCFEGHISALDAHLARFARSAAMLDLPAPNLDHVRAAVRRAVDVLTGDHPHEELIVKFVYTRGQEMGPALGRPGTAWALAYPLPDFSHERAGLAVVTLDRGLASTVMATSPWLLAGAKTLAYASNKAALREAKRRGADDVLFVSTDGHALEGPNSTLIARLDGVLVTPHPDEGVLPGTTQASIFAREESRGVRTETRPVLLSELADADALWLTSSGRLAAAIRTLDGRAYTVDAALTDEWNAMLRLRD